VITTKNTLQFS